MNLCFLSTSEMPALSLYLGTPLKEEQLTNFVLKVTMVFPIPTQAKQAEDGEHFANDEN